ncbi:zinc ABC transporter ATP-binding protein AztA [Ancylobacter lacus]|uniref:zinc ABC transporter ATP-binding protein AztA n=1 Tax=Ancylobacter lacus TaxID=2579970 RepID=UPI001BCC267E|nr:zinc ABC transporter ATP-binding protein AztA [Ancylobacter lacus]MBS7540035.1 ABC transporter ATP-binding protein [Ancylobacter lacus]
MASGGKVLAFRNLTLGYDRHPAVHHLHGEVPAGDMLAVCGPNGAGKSTLLKGIMGALRPLSGGIELAGLSPRDVAYLPQAAEVDRSFPISVYDLVSMGLWRRTGLFGGVGRADHRRIEEAIAAVGLAGFEMRPIGTLSGGQMQRSLFARLLLQDARLILLDEPFTALDAATVADLVALVERWNAESRTVLAVLHDFELVRRHFPRTLLLARTPVAWGATGEVLSDGNLRRARQMCEAWDEGAAICAPERAA